jgi:hypothetical protein
MKTAVSGTEQHDQDPGDAEELFDSVYSAGTEVDLMKQILDQPSLAPEQWAKVRAFVDAWRTARIALA